MSTKLKQLLSFLATGYLLSNVITVAAQQPGTFDPTFGNNGKTLTVMGSNAVAYAVIVQADGKIISGGQSLQNVWDAIMVRYHPNGIIDSSFGINGVIKTTFDTTSSSIYDLAIQSDGKILAAGSSPKYLLRRHHPDGLLDSTFNNDGIVTGNIPGRAQRIKILPDGKILTVGRTFGADSVVLAKFNINGTLDNSFGNGGIFLFTSIDVIPPDVDMIIQPDGKIVVTIDRYDYTTIRLNPNGTLDASFGINGVVITDIGGSNNQATGLVQQSDGKLVVVGYYYSSNGRRCAIARYYPNGSLDSTYSNDGIAAIQTIGFTYYADEIHSVLLQPDGKVIIGGFHNDGYDHFLLLLRMDTTGEKDCDFGTSWCCDTAEIANSYSVINDMAFLPDGKLIGVGTAGTQLLIVRYYLDEIGGCFCPVNLSTSNITSVSATLNWNININASTYRVRYKAVAATKWKTLKASNLTSKNISGLTSGTQYEWQVLSRCAISPLTLSQWSQSQFFTTLP